MEERLNKWLSRMGACSRREADRLISEGKVLVDGKTAQMGQRIEDGQKVICDGKPVGYSGVKPENDALFLSKIYITKEYRGKKLARFAMEQYVAYCRKNGLRKIWLTVNRHNSNTIAAYRKMGFETVREQVTEIGGDYVMDDYIMEKPVE